VCVPVRQRSERHSESVRYTKKLVLTGQLLPRSVRLRQFLLLAVVIRERLIDACRATASSPGAIALARYGAHQA